MTKRKEQDVESLRRHVKRLAGRKGAAVRQAQPNYDGIEATRPANEARWAKFRAIVDPEGVLDPAERDRLARRQMGIDLNNRRLESAKERLRAAKRSRPPKGRPTPWQRNVQAVAAHMGMTVEELLPVLEQARADPAGPREPD